MNPTLKIYYIAIAFAHLIVFIQLMGHLAKIGGKLECKIIPKLVSITIFSYVTRNGIEVYVPLIFSSSK
jgi:hypothetical protein